MIMNKKAKQGIKKGKQTKSHTGGILWVHSDPVTSRRVVIGKAISLDELVRIFLLKKER
jgi:hypothetical protein